MSIILKGFDIFKDGKTVATEEYAVPNYEKENASIRVVKPIGANKFFSSSSSTGAIKVVLPKKGSRTMMTFTVVVFDYAVNKTFEVRITGFNNSTGWVSTSANIIAELEDRDLAVRFGNDGTKDCVWIGELTSTWGQLGVYVTNFQGAFEQVDSLWALDWSISLVSSFDTVQTTKINSFPFSDANKLKNLTNTARTYTAIQTYSVSPTFPAAVNPTDAINKGQVEGMIEGTNATGTVLTLTRGGRNYNYSAPSSATSYSLVAGFKTNEFARCFINAPTEPTITGAVKVGGADFIPNTLMEMDVESPDGVAVEFYFIER